MKVSVIVPVYNVENYLKQCIESIINQTYKNIEIILVDDGSTDSSGMICDDYAKQDDRIQVVHKPNGGLSSARNAGIELMRGDYVLFIDSDDYYNSLNCIELLLKRAIEFNSDILSFSYKKSYEQANIEVLSNNIDIDLANFSCEERFKSILKNNLFIASACNKFIKTEIVKNTLFDVGVYSEDIDWCLRILLKSKSVDYINCCCYSYRQREGSITHSISSKSCNDLCSNILKCFDLVDSVEVNLINSIYSYVAFQYSTFFKVQALSNDVPTDSINKLAKKKWILKYHNNKKSFCLRILTLLFGFKLTCLIIRKTKFIWYIK